MCSWIVINYAWSPIGVPTHSSTNPGDEILCDLRRRHMKQRYISGIRWGVRENGGQGRDGEREKSRGEVRGAWFEWCVRREEGGQTGSQESGRLSPKTDFRAKRKYFWTYKYLHFWDPWGHLHFLFFFFFLRFCYIMNCQNGYEWWHLSNVYI